MPERPLPQPATATRWQRFIKASPRLHLTYQRQQAQLLAGLHLGLLAAALVVVVRSILLDPGLFQARAAGFGAALLLLAAGYGFSRTRYYAVTLALDTGLGMLGLFGYLGVDRLLAAAVGFGIPAAAFAWLAVQRGAVETTSEAAAAPDMPAEQPLSQSHSFLQSMLDSVPSHLAVLDGSGTIIAVNAAWREFADQNGLALPDHGIGANYLTTCEASYLNGLEDAQQTGEGIRAVIERTESGYQLEYACHSPDEQRWFMLRVVPFAGPEMARVLVSHQNVTEIKQAQDALERTMEMQRVTFDTLYRLIEQSPVGIQVFDVSGLCLNVNSAHLAIFGVPDREDYVGQFNILTDVMSEKSGARDGFLRAVRGEIVHLAEVHYDFSWADPRYSAALGRCTTNASFFPVHDQTKSIVNVVVLNQDITESRRAEEQGLELALERERVRLLRRFINDLSHDLRTPLATIGTSAYLLSREISPERRQYHIEILQAQVNRIDSALEEILSIAHLESAGEELAQTTLNLNELVGQVAARLQPLAASRKQDLRFQGDPAGIWLAADEARLGEAITNLVTNAISYTPEGGAIAVRTSRQGERAVIEVRDTGIGIGDADLPHIFEHFYRADKARSTDTGGVGLGLTIARRIVELHQGEITVESQPGKGSTFRIWLPL